MLKVFTFGPAWGLPTPSPFGMKLETWLRMADIPYECEYVQRMKNSPKGTVPWIRDGELELADSGFIIDHLKRTKGDGLNQGLSPHQLANAHAIRRMVEENLARIIGCTRWLTEENWPATREIGFGAMDEPWKTDISTKAREKLREDMYLHGIGRHANDEIQQIGLADVRTLEALIERTGYVIDDQPREVDASAFGILVQFVVPPLRCAISDYARESDVLRTYCDNMLARYFPDNARATA